jgi:hypothetical protein
MRLCFGCDNLRLVARPIIFFLLRGVRFLVGARPIFNMNKRYKKRVIQKEKKCCRCGNISPMVFMRDVTIGTNDLKSKWTCEDCDKRKEG